MTLNNVSNWVRTNISGTGDAAAYTSKAASTPVDAEYGRIQDGLTQVGKDIEGVDQDIQLKKVSLRSFKDSEVIVGSGAVGAVVGGGLGLANSELTSLLAKPQVEVAEVKHDIIKPEFKGFDKIETRPGHEVPVYDNNGHQTGTVTEHDSVHTHYEAKIEDKNVGSYTTRTHTVTNEAHGTPLVDGLVGMGIGFGIGAGLGTVVAVGRKALGQGYDGHDRAPVKHEGKKLLQTALVGSTIGAGAGLLNGLLESRNAIDTSYKTESPIINHTQIGTMPQDWDRSLLTTNPHPPTATQPVMGDVPKTNIFGHGETDTKTVPVHVDGRFGIAGGVIGGTVVGGVAGLAAGVAINVIRRAI